MSTEINGIDGQLPSGKVAIVASRYNAGICNALVKGSIETLTDAGFSKEQVEVIRVPGAWELSTVTQQIINTQKFIAVITLGCVIKGETTHDEHINRAVSLALMEMGVRSGIPIAFGLLTCNTLEQAINRSGGTVGNKGHEAAEAVLELLRLGLKIQML
ncbi:MAG: 6,7-dimethyl-8-ribityllumazine synthase [Rubripirellula sp.]|jgi:6,7-dimethyl-8-ribityllumazine synthase|nr:6,7-dimethyl-8-ribityllumazine synthase [Rubripirellula sp.]MDA9779251.1 6,7-dimethyl-8-ribityllumazine synthase [Rubripirellula sp.]